MTYAPRRKYQRTCATCAKVFAPWDSTQKFCSQACFGVSHTLPRPACERCGKPQPYRRHTTQRFCGRACASIAATTREPKGCSVCGVPISFESTTCVLHHHVPKRRLRERTCAVCSKKFTPYPSAIARSAARYCSRTCYQTQAALRPAMLTVNCATCGAEFRRTAAAIKRQRRSFCSRACLAESQKGPAAVNWRGGDRHYRGPGWAKIAEAIRERDGYRCRRCGRTQDDAGQRLSVDHIIPYRTFATSEEANVASNLVALCRTCHGKKNRAERLWLQGDVLDMWRYQVAVAEPWSDTRVGGARRSA